MPLHRPIRERDIERKVVAYCKKHGLVTYKFTSPSYAGVPDRIIMGRGRILFLELKAPGGRSTPLQVREQNRIRDVGCNAAMVDSIEGVIHMINVYILDAPPSYVVYRKNGKSGDEFV